MYDFTRYCCLFKTYYNISLDKMIQSSLYGVVMQYYSGDWKFGGKSKSNMAEFSSNPDSRNKTDVSFAEYQRRLKEAQYSQEEYRININKIRYAHNLLPYKTQEELEEVIEDSELDDEEELWSYLITGNKPQVNAIENHSDSILVDDIKITILHNQPAVSSIDLSRYIEFNHSTLVNICKLIILEYPDINNLHIINLSNGFLLSYKLIIAFTTYEKLPVENERKFSTVIKKIDKYCSLYCKSYFKYSKESLYLEMEEIEKNANRLRHEKLDRKRQNRKNYPLEIINKDVNITGAWVKSDNDKRLILMKNSQNKISSINPEILMSEEELDIFIFCFELYKPYRGADIELSNLAKKFHNKIDGYFYVNDEKVMKKRIQIKKISTLCIDYVRLGLITNFSILDSSSIKKIVKILLIIEKKKITNFNLLAFNRIFDAELNNDNIMYSVRHLLRSIWNKSLDKETYNGKMLLTLKNINNVLDL